MNTDFLNSLAFIALTTLVPQATPAPPPAAGAPSAPTPFICPENQPDIGARARELSTYFRMSPPGASVFDILASRKLMLQQHGCGKTLANMRAHAASVQNGDVMDQAWFPIRTSGEIKLDISITYLEPFLDPRWSSEKAVDTYARVTFPTSQETDVTHTRYDELVSRTVYYCGSRRHSLVRNDYFLNDRRVFVDPSPTATIAGVIVWPVETTKPGTLNADVAAVACGGLHALSS